jgi:subtilisin family serine protease
MSLRLLNIVKIVFFLFPTFLIGQDRYWVFFEDKQESVERFQLSDFLSTESIQRRAEQGIDVHVNDFPVSNSYINAVKNLGFEVYRSSRWLNAISVFIEHKNDLALIRELDFVSKIQKVKSYSRKNAVEELGFDQEIVANSYGPSFGQIAQLNGHLVHEQGYKGQGRIIAVMDASFYRVDELRMFDSLWINNQILETWDFVLNQELNYDIDTIGYHGTMVLSCMGGNMQDSLIGTAPKASYMLFRTEDTSSETLTEEDNWVAAAEQADALGAHVINTSLGYSNLTDDPENTHTYSDMDGNTTVITIAADIAASKGMLVVNSAGNSGSSEWYYITAPADGDSVLTIGAVGIDSVLTSFSSHGPTADGRMKPNVVAQGLFSVVCNLEDGIRTANGTSFSSPILAGMAASVWSAMPEVSSMDIFNLIQESGHLFPEGNNDYGYGVPNFYELFQHVSIDDNFVNSKSIYPNPFENYIMVDLSAFENSEKIELTVYNQLGQLVYFNTVQSNDYYRIEIDSALPKSFYILNAKQRNKEYHWKIVK